MSYKKCLFCGNNIDKNSLRRKFCCDKCSKSYRNINKKFTPVKTTCLACGIEFIKNDKWTKYCSKECRVNYNILKNKKECVGKKCIVCGNLFYPKYSGKKCCSDNCRRLLTNKLHKKNNKNKRKILHKKCIICGNYFNPRDKHIMCCSKECSEINKLNTRKSYYKKNKEILRKKNNKWRLKNIEYIKSYCKEYNIKNRKIITEKFMKRINSDVAFKLRYKISGGIYNSLKKTKATKNFKTFKLLEYTSKDIKLHLESMFLKGMSWGNYGSKWHIDHIKPVAAFKLIKEDGELDLEQIKLCWALDNLQPLWAKENISKGSWYEVDGKMCRFSNGEIVEIREGNL